MTKNKLTTLSLMMLMAPATSFADLEGQFAGALICPEKTPITVMACNVGGKSVINMYAEGANLVSLDKNSLKLTKLTVGSKNLLNTNAGDANYKLSTFSGIESDGKIAAWDIVLESGLKTLSNKVSIKGALTAYTGSGLATEESSLFDPENHPEMKVGPVRIISGTASTGEPNVLDKIKADGSYSKEHIALFEEMLAKGYVDQGKSLPEIERALTKAYPNLDQATKRGVGPMIMQYVMGSALSTTSTTSEDQIALRLELNDSEVENVALHSSSGKELESQGIMTSNGVKRYLFEKPKKGKVKLVVQYQKDLKPVNINIDI